MEERGLKISRKVTENLWYNEHQDSEIRLHGRNTKASEDIHTPRIDVGGGWKTGRGNHRQSAERVGEQEQSVRSVAALVYGAEGHLFVFVCFYVKCCVFVCQPRAPFTYFGLLLRFAHKHIVTIMNV